jgi:N-acetylneuraminic acid mutarotase
VLVILTSTSGTFAQEPQARFNHSAVWTGTEMIVWGGRIGTNSGSLANTGGRYNPVTRVWTTMSTNGAPSPREYHVAAWTGSEMIIWGGSLDPFTHYNNGARYNPTTDTWATITNTGTPTARSYHSMVWNGTHAIVWGGSSNSAAVGEVYYDTGSRYSPGSNNWAAVATNAAPLRRTDHTAVWASNSMIVWGGVAKLGALDPSKTNTGGRYNPSNNSWTATTTTGAPTGRASHTAVWTGNRMIVWGGVGRVTTTDIYHTGGRYDPVANSWAATSTNTGVPSPRQDHTAVWTGSEMIVWGGQGSLGNYRNSGGRYNPTTDTWTTTPLFPVARAYHTAVWTGSEMIIWGGKGNTNTSSPTGILQELGRYRPVENTWNTAPLCSLTAPANGSSHGASAAITLTAAVSDSDGNITQVQFLDGTTLLNTDTGTPYSYNWSGGSPGAHTLTAVATDNTGLKTTSAPVSITIIGPPVVSLTSPTDGATIPSGNPIAIAATATPAAGAAISQVRFYDGAVLLHTDTDNPYQYNWTGAALGAHTLTARVTDNYGTSSTSAPVAITVLNSPPNTSILAPSDGVVIAASLPVTVSATASDPDGSVTQVAFYDGPTLLGVTNSAPYQINWANVPPGLRMLTTRATDNLGKMSTSAPVTITANSLPSVAVTSPQATSKYVPTELIPLSANASDSDGTVQEVEFFVNGGLVGSSATPPYTNIWGPLPLGIHNLTSVATDNHGMKQTSAPVVIEAVLKPKIKSAYTNSMAWIHLSEGETNRQYRIDYSTNMTTWLPLQTNVTTDGKFSISDGPNPPGSRRFYRAIPLP